VIVLDSSITIGIVNGEKDMQALLGLLAAEVSGISAPTLCGLPWRRFDKASRFSLSWAATTGRGQGDEP
jgi:hypothetical protein